MVMNPGDPVPQDRLIHPRIEPEIVFVMKDRLEGPGVTRESAMAAVLTGGITDAVFILREAPSR